MAGGNGQIFPPTNLVLLLLQEGVKSARAARTGEHLTFERTQYEVRNG